ncbi:glycosyltransferase family 4 protein [Hymenobacter sp. DG25A]|uniref:glycosyltransferase family 4 protein n=1 Tax=Hymenobacter sp. DG25A TaxID=1385663 RepID=UPI0006BD4ED7|nr:glycosyltransferase family 4 protein [Hymenobacter sp. DG25A]ALD21550.1 hypothetical protein AM218_10440 [Hymenobacter sp. DG25A]
MPQKTTKPVILIADNSTAVTGALMAIWNATDPLRHNFEFIYVLPKNSQGRNMIEKAGYVVHELPFVEISRRKGDLVRYLPMLLLNGWRVFQLIRQHNVALLHVNDFYNLTGYIAKLLSFGRLRLVIHVRFLPQSLIQPLARMWRWLGEHYADRVICVSEAVRHYFDAPNVHVVFDPIPGVERHPAAPTPAIRPDSTVQLLYLSNYIQGKGHDLALQAFQHAYTSNPNLRLTFLGGDMGMPKNQKFRQLLESTVLTQGLTNVVSFGGFVKDVELAIKQADIILNFSESESFSLTCLDALFYGTPLIATDCGGPAELFENEKSGLLVPNRDVSAMTVAILRLADNISLRQQFSKEGRSFVQSKFNAGSTYDKIRKIYEGLL